MPDKKYPRRPPRLVDRTYFEQGWYFVTINTKNRRHYFGHIQNGEMHLSPMGIIAQQNWLEIFALHENAAAGPFVIMPDHFHALIHLSGSSQNNWIPGAGGVSGPKCNMLKPGSLGYLIRRFKAKTTRLINIEYGEGFFQWVPNYWERVIRNEPELKNVSEYIRNNPQNWDEENPIDWGNGGIYQPWQ